MCFSSEKTSKTDFWYVQARLLKRTFQGGGVGVFCVGGGGGNQGSLSTTCLNAT